MFAIGFLIIGALFLVCLILVSRLLPSGAWRLLFIGGVLAFIFTYPFLHLIRPSYARFKELCLHPSPPVIIKTKPVDFILLNWGYSSDCTEGPAYIANRGYLGFDCVRNFGSNPKHEFGTELYRYTKRPDTDPACGLECFDAEKIAKAEANFGLFDNSSRTRAGYLADDKRHVTIDYPYSRNEKEKPIPFWQWLQFSDDILVDADEGDMAFTTHYMYLPYGPIKALGLASGGAPLEECPRLRMVDPRDVYIPKHPTANSGKQ